MAMLTVMRIPKYEEWADLFRECYNSRSEVLFDLHKSEDLLLKFEQSVNSFHDYKEGQRWEKSNEEFQIFLLRRKGYLSELLREKFPEPVAPRGNAKLFMQKNKDLFDNFYRCQKDLEFALLKIKEAATIAHLNSPKNLPYDLKLQPDLKNHNITMKLG